MEKKIESICDKTVYNYRKAREELRFDGDYINHMSALIYGSQNMDIPSKKVKEIRTTIKRETSRMSSFRGDILYILSFLIALQENSEIFIKELIDTYGQLRDFEFRDSQYLVLASFAIVKHVKKEERFTIVAKMRQIYEAIRYNYNNVTNHEDYLECALLAINNIEPKLIIDYIENLYEEYGNLESLTNNGIQAFAMTSILNRNAESKNRSYKLLREFDKADMKICHQFLPLLGEADIQCEAEEYINKINNIITYLCDEEGEYEFYMDRSFRVFIGIVIIEYARNNKEERYLNELLAKGVYSLLVSKNQGIFDEVLAE